MSIACRMLYVEPALRRLYDLFSEYIFIRIGIIIAFLFVPKTDEFLVSGLLRMVRIDIATRAGKRVRRHPGDHLERSSSW